MCNRSNDKVFTLEYWILEIHNVASHFEFGVLKRVSPVHIIHFYLFKLEHFISIQLLQPNSSKKKS